jgi:phosphoglycerate dehydrogenase-like enzyme
MKIVFHGGNAANFRHGFEELLKGGPYQIFDVGDALDGLGEKEHFATADVIVGVKLGASQPVPAKLSLYHAPAAGTDAIDRSRLPSGSTLCNCFGHEHAIAEYVMTALLLRHVPIPDADAKLRKGDWAYWAGPSGRTAHGAWKPDDRALGLRSHRQGDRCQGEGLRDAGRGGEPFAGTVLGTG